MGCCGRLDVGRRLRALENREAGPRVWLRAGCGAVLRLWARMRTGGGGRMTAPTTAGKLTARNKPACSSRWDLTSAGVPVRWSAERGSLVTGRFFVKMSNAGDVFQLDPSKWDILGADASAPPVGTSSGPVAGPATFTGRRSDGTKRQGHSPQPLHATSPHKPNPPEAPPPPRFAHQTGPTGLRTARQPVAGPRSLPMWGAWHKSLTRNSTEARSWLVGGQASSGVPVI